MDSSQSLKPALRRASMSTSTPPTAAEQDVEDQRSNSFLLTDDDDTLGNEMSFADEEHTHTSVHEKEESIAGYEDLLVQYSKALILTVTVFFAVSMGIITFQYIRGREHAALERHFKETSKEIRRLSQLRAKDIFEKIEAMGSSITFHAESNNMTWPFVVVPDFQSHAQVLVSNQVSSGAVSTLAIHPLVEPSLQDRWATFSQYTYYSWMRIGHLYEEQVDNIPSRPFINRTHHNQAEKWDTKGIAPYIWRPNDTHATFRYTSTSDFYFPYWQHVPAADYNPIVNKDVSQQEPFVDAIAEIMSTKLPVLTNITNATFLDNQYESSRFQENELLEPHLYYLQPLRQSLAAEDAPIVGFLSAFIRFAALFEDLLPAYESYLKVIVANSCDERPNSYRLWPGGEVQFVGFGNITENLPYQLRLISGVSWTIAASSNATCEYTATIFPSPHWQTKYYTAFPAYAGLVACACFMISCLLFTFYDSLVRERQKVVMDKAMRTSKIVSNLFPSNVRSKMIEEAIKSEDEKADNEKQKYQSIMQRFTNGNNSPRASFAGLSPRRDGQEMNDNSTHSAGSRARSRCRVFGSDPIADFFPECTIMFADIAGFTKWSSERQPTQVFTLLETLYHAFDSIARRRRVFKIETIGDCYVAVCGVPNANKMHAVVMARFASDCLLRMSELVRGDLQKVLGPETANLALRVGLHSGSVTAGVLRGDRGRFQLFGDTMNTASRMESTGCPWKIQISEATEKLLTAAGKTWTRRREEEIQAKGKGTMQTYWLEIKSRSAGSIPDDTNADATSVEMSQEFFSNHDGKKGNQKSDEKLQKQAQTRNQAVVRRRSDGDLGLLDQSAPTVEGRRHSVHGDTGLLDPTAPIVEGRRHSVHGAQLYSPSAM